MSKFVDPIALVVHDIQGYRYFLCISKRNQDRIYETRYPQYDKDKQIARLHRKSKDDEKVGQHKSLWLARITIKLQSLPLPLALLGNHHLLRQLAKKKVYDFTYQMLVLLKEYI